MPRWPWTSRGRRPARPRGPQVSPALLNRQPRAPRAYRRGSVVHGALPLGGGWSAALQRSDTTETGRSTGVPRVPVRQQPPNERQARRCFITTCCRFFSCLWIAASRERPKQLLNRRRLNPLCPPIIGKRLHIFFCLLIFRKPPVFTAERWLSLPPMTATAFMMQSQQPERRLQWLFRIFLRLRQMLRRTLVQNQMKVQQNMQRRGFFSLSSFSCLWGRQFATVAYVLDHESIRHACFSFGASLYLAGGGLPCERRRPTRNPRPPPNGRR